MNDLIRSMAWMGFVRVLREVRHFIGWCRCHDYWGRWDTPCEIGLEEIALRKRERQYREWDGLGLGYVGPSRNC